MTFKITAQMQTQIDQWEKEAKDKKIKTTVDDSKTKTDLQNKNKFEVKIDGVGQGVFKNSQLEADLFAKRYLESQKTDEDKVEEKHKLNSNYDKKHKFEVIVDGVSYGFVDNPGTQKLEMKKIKESLTNRATSYNEALTRVGQPSATANDSLIVARQNANPNLLPRGDAGDDANPVQGTIESQKMQDDLYSKLDTAETRLSSKYTSLYKIYIAEMLNEHGAGFLPTKAEIDKLVFADKGYKRLMAARDRHQVKLDKLENYDNRDFTPVLKTNSNGKKTI